MLRLLELIERIRDRFRRFIIEVQIEKLKEAQNIVTQVRHDLMMLNQDFDETIHSSKLQAVSNIITLVNCAKEIRDYGKVQYTKEEEQV